MVLIIPTLSYSQKVISEIKTSAICDMCKERIEEELNYTKGISWSKLDLETNSITVKYKTKKIELHEIKQIVSSIGYDADDIKANKEALNKLPNCCKPQYDENGCEY